MATATVVAIPGMNDDDQLERCSTLKLVREDGSRVSAAASQVLNAVMNTAGLNRVADTFSTTTEARRFLESRGEKGVLIDEGQFREHVAERYGDKMRVFQERLMSSVKGYAFADKLGEPSPITGTVDITPQEVANYQDKMFVRSVVDGWNTEILAARELQRETGLRVSGSEVNERMDVKHGIDALVYGNEGKPVAAVQVKPASFVLGVKVTGRDVAKLGRQVKALAGRDVPLLPAIWDKHEQRGMVLTGENGQPKFVHPAALADRLASPQGRQELAQGLRELSWNPTRLRDAYTAMGQAFKAANSPQASRTHAAEMGR